MTSARAHWATRFGFIMAAMGSAVGLGNFWRFPYLTGENGGGAFVIVYLGAVIIVILPLLIAEFVIGRRGQGSAIASTARVAQEAGSSAAWGLVGLIGLVAGFLILSFYSVIGGWVLSYITLAASGEFTGAKEAAVGELFTAMLADPTRLIINHALFLGITVAIVALGVSSGLELVNSILMPLLFVMLVGLVVYAAIEGDFTAAINFLVLPDWSKLTAESVLRAITQGFFSVGVGIALMVTYAGYAQKQFDLGSSAFLVAICDTAIALLAGLAIFPVLFGHGLDPAQGPGLTFVTLPIALGDLPGATIAVTVFFSLLFFAAITSSISLLEIAVAYLVEKGVTRVFAATGVGVLLFVVGLGTVYSFNQLSGFHPLDAVPGFKGKTIFDSIDFLTANIMLPVGGILIAVLAGWVMKWSAFTEELGWSQGMALMALRILLMFVCPLAIGAVLVANLLGY